MDDEELIRFFAEEMLSSIGFHVEAACNGDEAISLYKSNQEKGQPFDVVILDINICDGMGGRETIHQLTQIDPDIKAIVSSGNYTDPLMVNFKEHGFRETLPKPYNMKNLKWTLSKVIEMPHELPAIEINS